MEKKALEREIVESNSKCLRRDLKFIFTLHPISFMFSHLLDAFVKLGGMKINATIFDDRINKIIYELERVLNALIRRFSLFIYNLFLRLKSSMKFETREITFRLMAENRGKLLDIPIAYRLLTTPFTFRLELFIWCMKWCSYLSYRVSRFTPLYMWHLKSFHLCVFKLLNLNCLQNIYLELYQQTNLW